MNGWIAAILAVGILAVLGLSLGFFALYQKSKENKVKQH